MVLNRHQKRSLITDNEIEKTLGQKIYLEGPQSVRARGESHQWWRTNCTAFIVRGRQESNGPGTSARSKTSRNRQEEGKHWVFADSWAGVKGKSWANLIQSSQLGGTNGLPIAEIKRTGLSFKEYQDLKSGVHRDLISRVDLERVANQRDDHTRGQVLGGNSGPGCKSEDPAQRTRARTAGPGSAG